MESLSNVVDWVRPVLPTAAAVAGLALALFLVHRLLERRLVSSHRFMYQVGMLAVTVAGLLVVIAALPISDTLRGQLLALGGILLSAAIALSATTFLGNALAGIMLRAVQSFRMGDFIRAGDHFGRVSERGLFHTEIQTEDRELTTLPNLFLVTHPVTTIRTSGTIISATVSLGYDVSRRRAEDLMRAAATKAGLEKPFVHVLELGDFSVTYRIAGLLTEVKQLLSARSTLRCRVLDELHQGGVEIVSPSFMNTRALPEGKLVIPEPVAGADLPAAADAPEKLVFDKADEAELIETLKGGRDKLKEQAEALDKRIKEAGDDERARLEGELAVIRRRIDGATRLIDARISGGDDA